MLAVDSAGVYFTSGGSESNFLAIHALLTAKQRKGRHIITSQAEHSSVLNLMKKLEQDGYEITYLPLNSDGFIEIQDVLESIKDETILVSIQHANSEIGTLQPLKEISRSCREKGIFLHSDCVQSFGKTDIQEIAQAVDALSISGHKFYGPKGTGVAYVNPRLAWQPWVAGTTHERGFRPGTVNVPGIVAMTAAAQKACTRLEEERNQFILLRKSFVNHLDKWKDKLTIFGSSFARGQLPGIIGMRIYGLEGQWIMLECNRRGFAISTGSACHTDLLTPATTMSAMGITGKQAKEFFRISFGRQTREEDVIELAKLFAELIDQSDFN